MQHVFSLLNDSWTRAAAAAAAAATDNRSSILQQSYTLV